MFVKGVVVVGLLVCAQFSDALYQSSGPVEELTASNFNSKVINSNDVWLVEFYAPWCGHCKNLAPEWTKAAKALKGIVRVGAVDMDQHQSVGAPYNVRGFPTIKIFGANKNAPKDYNSGRDANSIVQAGLQEAKEVALGRLNGNSGSSGSGSGGDDAVITLTESNFEKMVMKSEDLWMVEFYAPWCGHCKNLAPEWKKAANRMKGKVKYGAVDATVHGGLAQKYGVQGYPTIKFFGSDKTNPEDYNGGRTSSDLIAFSESKMEMLAEPPEVMELVDNDVMEKECKAATVCFVAFLPHILDSSAAGRNKYIKSLETLAEKFKRKPFAWLWIQGGTHLELEKSLDIGGFGYPAMAALSSKKGKYSAMKGSFSEKSISSFVNRLLSGKEALGNAKNIPALEKVEPWDGKDGKVPDEL
eukprot:Nk52_evm6s386 gene=Nk52_evmTU6s386